MGQVDLMLPLVTQHMSERVCGYKKDVSQRYLRRGRGVFTEGKSEVVKYAPREEKKSNGTQLIDLQLVNEQTD